MSTILDPPSWEMRLLAACLGASAVLHGIVLAVAPYLRHAHELEPPRVLSVLLPAPARMEEPAARVAEPPAPPPPRPKLPPRRAPAPARAPPVEAPAAAPAPAPLTTAPAVTDTGPKQEQPAAVQASPAAPAPAAPAVAGSRESASPPDFRAAYLRNPAPTYPTAARRNGEEGTVTLRVLVSTDGVPREVMLERSSGSSSLDAAALNTVKTWRFTPARRAGEAQEAWVLVPIVFRLEPRG